MDAGPGEEAVVVQEREDGHVDYSQGARVGHQMMNSGYILETELAKIQ